MYWHFYNFRARRLIVMYYTYYSIFIIRYKIWIKLIPTALYTSDKTSSLNFLKFSLSAASHFASARNYPAHSLAHFTGYNNFGEETAKDGLLQQQQQRGKESVNAAKPTSCTKLCVGLITSCTLIVARCRCTLHEPRARRCRRRKKEEAQKQKKLLIRLQAAMLRCCCWLHLQQAPHRATAAPTHEACSVQRAKCNVQQQRWVAFSCGQAEGATAEIIRQTVSMSVNWN